MDGAFRETGIDVVSQLKIIFVQKLVVDVQKIVANFLSELVTGFVHQLVAGIVPGNRSIVLNL